MVVTGPIKYSVLQINAKGRVILPGETDAAVTERYFFALPYFWQLDAINPDREAAIRTFIDYRGAAPVECAEGYRVAYHGLNEGGSTYAVLECVGRACARKVQEILWQLCLLKLPIKTALPRTLPGQELHLIDNTEDWLPSISILQMQ
jgi:hypothetical protein